MDSGGRRVRLGLPWPPEPRAGGRECGEQGAGRGCRLLLRTPTGPLDSPSHRPPPAASGRSARGHRGGGGEGEGRARPETHGRPDQAAPGWPQCLGLTRQRQRQLPRALSKETGSLRWGRPAGGTARLGPPPSTPRARREAPGDLHMKGLTVLWMCLCCLRPEDVAKVLPQSGQACARAPTCWDRMCRCRLLGSVNTWGTDAVGRRPSTCPGRRTGPPAALPPAQARAAVATPGGPQRAVEAPLEPVPSLHDNSQETCGQGGCEAGAQRETVCSWGPGRAPGPCRPPLPRGESGPASCGPARPAAWPGPLGDLLLEGRARYLHAVFTFEALAAVVGHLVANEVGLPVEGLGALVTLVLSLLRVDDHVLLQAAQGAQGSRPGPSAPAARRRGALGPAWPVLSGGHGGQHSLLRGQSASWHASVHCPSGQASGMEAQRRPSGASSGPF